MVDEELKKNTINRSLSLRRHSKETALLVGYIKI
jgi:hypothetical protein